VPVIIVPVFVAGTVGPPTIVAFVGVVTGCMDVGVVVVVVVVSLSFFQNFHPASLFPTK